MIGKILLASIVILLSQQSQANDYQSTFGNKSPIIAGVEGSVTIHYYGTIKDRKLKELILRDLIKNAVFLENDPQRKQRWISSIPLINDSLLHNLLGAILRENRRYLKGTRDLVTKLNRDRRYKNRNR